MNKIEDFVPREFIILNDFEVLIDYIVENKPSISKKANNIASKYVVELNQKLNKPLKLDLKQHSQTSYPYINSLMLILRASGLGITNFSKNNFFLTIDSSVYKQWKKLNDTEKYINLLIAWIFNGVPSIIGIKKELTYSFENTLNFMLTTPAKKKIINQEEIKTFESPMYSVGIHNLVLLEMFGFVEIIDNSNIVSKKWNLQQITIKDIGLLFYEEIYTVVEKFEGDFFYQDFFPIEFKMQLQERFKKLLPNYSTDIQIKTTKQTNKEYIFKVTLGRIFRRIAIPSDYPLGSFCSYLIDCFDFDHSHLYRITIKNRFGYNEIFNHPSIEDDYFGYPNVSEFSMNDLNIMQGTTMNFEYDFGDNWQFEIVCENIENQKTKKSRIIEKKGKSPEQYE